MFARAIEPGALATAAVPQPPVRAKRARDGGEEPQVAVTRLRTAGGEVDVRVPAGDGGVRLPEIVCSSPHLLLPLLPIALALMVIMPVASEAKIRSAFNTFSAVLTFWGCALANVNWAVVMAFIVLRCSPPVGIPLPACCSRPVLAPTVAGDIDALRRAARLGLHGLAQILDALLDERVTLLLRSIGSRVKRLKTSKRPLLFTQVSSAVLAALRGGSAIVLRDACALCVAFFFATRVSELLALSWSDVAVVRLCGGRRALRLTFRKCKNRQTIFASHEPCVVSCAHPLLMRIWCAFVATVPQLKRGLVFTRLSGSTRDALSRDWFAGVIRAAAPGTTPHSARVGAATELWAARVPLREIMAVGRWSSPAAVLYIISTLESQIAATDAIGSAGALSISDGDLRRAGLSIISDRASASVESWEAILRDLDRDV